MIQAGERRLAVVREGSWGEVDASAAWAALPVRSESLMEVIKRVRSDALTGTRLPGEVLTLESGARGGLVMGWRTGAVDTVLAGALGGDWPGGVAVTSDDITGVTAGGLVSLDQGGDGFAAGDMVRLSGFADALNSGVFAVLAASPIMLTLDGATAVEAVVPDGARIEKVGVRAGPGAVTATAMGLASGAGGPDFVAEGLAVGDWLYVGGFGAAERFASAGTAGLVRVASVTAAALELDHLPSGWAADDGSGKTIALLYGRGLEAGGDVPSFAVEKKLGETVFRFSGMAVDRLEVVISAGEEVQVTAGLEGGAVSVAEGGAVAVAASAIAPVLVAGQDVGRLMIDGANAGGPNYIRRIDLVLENGIKATRSLGELAPVGLTEGLAELSGRMVAWFGDKALYERFAKGEALSLVVALVGAGSGYVLELPSIVFDGAEVVIDGPDEDVLAEFSFLATGSGVAPLIVHAFGVLP